MAGEFFVTFLEATHINEAAQDVANVAFKVANTIQSAYQSMFGGDSTGYEIVGGFGRVPVTVGPLPEQWSSIRADDVYDVPVGQSWVSTKVVPEVTGFRDEKGFHWYFGGFAEAHLYNNGSLVYQDKTGRYIDGIKTGTSLKMPPPSPKAVPIINLDADALQGAKAEIDKQTAQKVETKETPKTEESNGYGKKLFAFSVIGLLGLGVYYGVTK